MGLELLHIDRHGGGGRSCLRLSVDPQGWRGDRSARRSRPVWWAPRLYDVPCHKGPAGRLDFHRHRPSRLVHETSFQHCLAMSLWRDTPSSLRASTRLCAGPQENWYGDDNLHRRCSGSRGASLRALGVLRSGCFWHGRPWPASEDGTQIGVARVERRPPQHRSDLDERCGRPYHLAPRSSGSCSGTTEGGSSLGALLQDEYVAGRSENTRQAAAGKWHETWEQVISGIEEAVGSKVYDFEPA